MFHIYYYIHNTSIVCGYRQQVTTCRVIRCCARKPPTRIIKIFVCSILNILIKILVIPTRQKYLLFCVTISISIIIALAIPTGSIPTTRMFSAKTHFYMNLSQIFLLLPLALFQSLRRCVVASKPIVYILTSLRLPATHFIHILYIINLIKS